MIVVGPAVVLFGVMIRNLIGLGRYVLAPPGTIAVTALFVITLGLVLRFGDLRIRRSRAHPLSSPE